MRTVELFDIKGRPKRYSLPATWKECTHAQLATIARLSAIPLPGEDQEEERERALILLRLQLLRSLAAIPARHFARIDPADLIELVPDDLGVDQAAFLPCLDPFLTTPFWAESLLPTLRVQRETWIGPRDRLANLTVKQWGFADAMYARWATKPEHEALRLVVATLYHPAGSSWSNDYLEHHAIQLRHVHRDTLLAAAFNYAGLRAQVVAQYPKVFRGGTADSRGIHGLIVDLAGDKFGTVHQAQQARLHDVFIYLERCIDRMEAAKQPTI